MKRRNDMSKLPYFTPDDELSLNVGVLMLMLEKLAATSRGRLLLNNERLRAYLYLIKNPLILNRVLRTFDYPVARLEAYDEYSVASISANLDPLHDDHRLKRYLRVLAGYGFIDVKYKKTEGFLYKLSAKGKAIEKSIDDDYFCSVRSYMEAMVSLNNVSTSNLNSAIETGGKYE